MVTENYWNPEIIWVENEMGSSPFFFGWSNESLQSVMANCNARVRRHQYPSIKFWTSIGKKIKILGHLLH